MLDRGCRRAVASAALARSPVRLHQAVAVTERLRNAHHTPRAAGTGHHCSSPAAAADTSSPSRARRQRANLPRGFPLRTIGQMAWRPFGPVEERVRVDEFPLCHVSHLLGGATHSLHQLQSVADRLHQLRYRVPLAPARTMVRQPDPPPVRQSLRLPHTGQAATVQRVEEPAASSSVQVVTSTSATRPSAIHTRQSPVLSPVLPEGSSRLWSATPSTARTASSPSFSASLGSVPPIESDAIDLMERPRARRPHRDREPQRTNQRRHLSEGRRRGGVRSGRVDGVGYLAQDPGLRQAIAAATGDTPTVAIRL